ncbi:MULTISPECIES: PIG-L deacetylase family protein [Catenuloplanes]|uniref:LmbE family N-acetylglucosaminyl deacetylase n=1 Tax=Catenuloplanes niger TaxID=587534 RepID=A0AAE4CZZ7_9ACTN|nr:PIG-L deacetylase family protein [Catenuloplanes niger]MDR7327419.1 LmbE family N-acetylglucosaminyl deacetylase [Catenuloplanes niger]
MSGRPGSPVRGVARRLVQASGTRWRRRVAARAADATDTLTGRALMVLAPHPDDETFGCGALIARARANGDPVTVVVATDGARSTTSARLSATGLARLRTGELHAACTELGVTDVVQLGFPDGTLTANRDALTARLGALFEDRRPGHVLLPCREDAHPDHRALHHAGLAAGPVRAFAYPVWAWFEAPVFPAAAAADRARLWAWAAARSGWLRVPAGPFLDAKRQAIAAYASQTTNLTGEPGWSHLDPRFVAAFLGPHELFRALTSRAVEVRD